MTTIQLNSCSADRPDRRAITKTIEEYGDGMDHNLAAELCDIMIDGSPAELTISQNESSAFRTFRKLGVDYEILE